MRPKTILLVEDNPSDVALTKRALERSHVANDVVVAEDGQEALDYLLCMGVHASRDPTQMPAVVLLDLKLPKLDGFGVLRRLRADHRTRRLPVVVLTSSSEEQDVAASYDLGVNSYMRKPVDFTQFAHAIHQLGLYWLLLNAAAPAGEPEVSQSLRVLQVEDSETDAEMVVRTLRKAGYQVEAERVETAAEMRAALAREAFHVVLADYQLPQFDAPGALALLQESGQDLPFIVVSGMVGEDAAVAMMKGGAHDYLMKDRLTRLAPAVERELREAQSRRDRKGAEQALRESEERFRTLFLDAPIGVALGDEETRFIDVNHALCRMLGYSRDELLHRRIVDITHPDDTQATLASYEGMAQGRIPGWGVEKRYLKKDGTSLWASTTVASIRDPQGHFLYSIGMIEDISDRKRAEAALRDSEERFRGVFQGVTDGILLAEIDSGAFVMANPAICQMLGYSEQEILALSVKDIHPPGQMAGVSEAFQRQITGDQRPVPRLVVQRKDGSTFVADISGVPILLGGRRCMLGVFRDMTSFNELEQQMRQAQKMEAIGQLAGGVAHDFNNILAVILGYSEIVRRRLTGAQHSRIDQIHKAAERGASLTRQLLAFSRKQVLEPRVLELNALVREISPMLRRLIGEDVGLVTVFGDGLGQVKADEGQMQQVLMNLAVNARDAMPRGGTLTIETTHERLDAGPAGPGSEARPGDYVVLTVRDTGHGMDAATLSRIFEPFFTTKEPGKGTGLGLATVYGVVKQSGGHVHVESEPGKGATFRVVLPMIEGRVEPRRPEARLGSLAGGSEVILLLEDDAALRALEQEILEGAGYHVIVAARPDGVLVDGALPDRIDLLVSDVVMPGMSGPELAAKLLERRPELRILYVSGYAADVLARRGVSKTDTRLLDKPFTTEAILREVRAALDAPALAAPQPERH